MEKQLITNVPPPPTHTEIFPRDLSSANASNVAARSGQTRLNAQQPLTYGPSLRDIVNKPSLTVVNAEHKH